MPNVLIRNVPEMTLEVLRKRARRAGRSLQQELLAVLEHSARTTLLAEDALKATRRFRERLAKKGIKFTDSVQLIREDRER